MAERPTRPTVPAAPDRQQPSTFAERADAMVAFLQTLVDYMEAAQSYTDQRAGDADAAVLAAGGFGTLNLANFAGKAIGVNVGGNMLVGITFQDLDKAAGAVATGGTDDDAYMTSLATKQLAEALFPSNNGWVKITEKTASNSASLIFSGSDFNSGLYRDYQFILANVLPASDSATLRLVPSDDGGSNATSIKLGNATAYTTPGHWNLTPNVGMSTDEPGASGPVTIYNFHEDKGALARNDMLFIRNNGQLVVQVEAADLDHIAASLQRPSVDDALNYIRFEMSTGNISSGSITLMGLRG